MFSRFGRSWSVDGCKTKVPRPWVFHHNGREISSLWNDRSIHLHFLIAKTWCLPILLWNLTVWEVRLIRNMLCYYRPKYGFAWSMPSVMKPHSPMHQTQITATVTLNAAHMIHAPVPQFLLVLCTELVTRIITPSQGRVLVTSLYNFLDNYGDSRCIGMVSVEVLL